MTQVRYESLKKQLKLLGVNLEKIENHEFTSRVAIISPLNGFITEIYKTPGQYVTPTDEVLSIINLGHIHLDLYVFEKDFPKLELGQSVFFRIPGNQMQEQKASIFLIGKQIEDKKRAVNVHAHLESEEVERRLLPGMYVEARIQTDLSEATCLPEEAIVSADDQNYILIQKPKEEMEYVFEKRLVQIGRVFDGLVEVQNVGDFKGTESVLVKGAFNLIAEE